MGISEGCYPQLIPGYDDILWQMIEIVEGFLVAPHLDQAITFDRMSRNVPGIMIQTFVKFPERFRIIFRHIIKIGTKNRVS